MEGNLFSTMALLVVACLSRAASQPVGCTDDGQCGTGYYCVKDMCRKCLKCEDFKRNPPLVPTKCVTSVSDCGRCSDGLVESVHGDLLEPCVPDDVDTRLYLWVAIGLVTFVFVAVAVAAVVIYRLKLDFPRILSSTRTSVQSGCVNGAVATAPELPPPYNTLYSPVRPDSPAQAPEEESVRPFIKRPPPPDPARESAGTQEVNWYNNPNYVRGPHLPSNGSAEREPEPEFLQDENTAESPWTPDTANNNVVDDSESSSGSAGVSTSGAAGAAGVSQALAAARLATLVRPPCQDAATPNKLPRLRQDTNNNRNARDSGESARGGPTVNILVNVQQLNDVQL